MKITRYLVVGTWLVMAAAYSVSWKPQASAAAPTQNFTISGLITQGSTPGSGPGIAGVNVQLLIRPSTTTNATTDSNGAFSFQNVPSGSDFEVTPSKSGWTFQPQSQGGVLGQDRTLFFTGATATQTPTPVIITETGTNNVATVDSVVFTRGPFALAQTHNFSSDHRTRIVFLTSDLALTQPNPGVLSVQASGVSLSVEAVGPFTRVPGFTLSYVAVRLPDNLVPGTYQLTVTLNGVTSSAAVLTISP